MAVPSISFFVPGVARPAGSKIPGQNRKTGKLFVRDACADTKNWQATVAWNAMNKRDGGLLGGPLSLFMEFVIARPKHHYRTGRRAAELKDTAPHWCVSRPDSCKLQRAIEDALTGVIWNDDSQVSLVHSERRYADVNEPIGVHIVIRELAQGRWMYGEEREEKATLLA